MNRVTECNQAARRQVAEFNKSTAHHISFSGIYGQVKAYGEGLSAPEQMAIAADIADELAQTGFDLRLSSMDGRPWSRENAVKFLGWPPFAK